MVKKLKKNMSLDDLAVMVSNGFDRVDKRMDSFERRMDSLDEGQEQIKLKLDNVAYRFNLWNYQGE